MKVSYQIKKGQYYSDKNPEYTIEIDDSFEFAECINPWNKEGYKHYISVVQNASNYKKIIDKLNKLFPVTVYELPYDTVIISLTTVQFLDKEPKMITLDELNDKLKYIRENVVWAELQSDNFEVLNLYRLTYINGDEDVVVCNVTNRALYQENEVLYKSIEFSTSCRISDVLNKIHLFSDHRIVKTLYGEEANVIWSSLINKALKNVIYNPELVDENYNFHKFHDEVADVLNAFMNREILVERIEKKEDI